MEKLIYGEKYRFHCTGGSYEVFKFDENQGSYVFYGCFLGARARDIVKQINDKIERESMFCNYEL